MAFLPPQPLSALNAASSVLNGGGPPQPNGFNVPAAPSIAGYGTRQGRVLSERPAVFTRNLIHWLVPNGPIIQMYINPQSIAYSDKKGVTTQRTKGGYALQYWGEDLGTIKLSGTTGTSGIEGINVLRDIYRNEQLAMDPYALFIQDAANQAAQAGGPLGSLFGGDVGGAVGGLLTQAVDSLNPNATQPAPSLAQIAFTVELYWSGEVYRGFFTDFNVNERADNLGFFEYDIGFTVTQRRGFRSNFMAWHRSATNGPSDSDPIVGRPLSYGILMAGEAPTPSAIQAPSIGASITSSLGSLF